MKRGDGGASVVDLQRRLRSFGHLLVDEGGYYGPATTAAVERYQLHAGLDVDGICGRVTWNALVEAGHQLGDRLLYYRSPMMRGDDVSQLQRQLGALGFDPGRVDGIFGPRGAAALAEFQRNSGLANDAICGPETVLALQRLGRSTDTLPVAQVREFERLSGAPRSLDQLRLALVDPGGLGALVSATAHLLRDNGSRVAILDHPDGSSQAKEANALGAGAFLAFRVSQQPGVRALFFQTSGFESLGGRKLAHLVVESLEPVGFKPGELLGRRLPVLRETRMPAIVVELGPPMEVVTQTAEIASALLRTLMEWVLSPMDLGSM